MQHPWQAAEASKQSYPGDLPLVHRFDGRGLQAVQLAAALAAEEHFFFLDSSSQDGQLCRYSYLGYDPFLVLTYHQETTLIENPITGARQVVPGAPWHTLKALLGHYRLPRRPGLPPFWSGAVGYLAYDLGRTLEELPATSAEDPALPHLVLAFYDTVVIFDHQQNQVILVATGLPALRATTRWRRAQARLTKLEEHLRQYLAPAAERTLAPKPLPRELSPALIGAHSNFSPESYRAMVQQARNYIAAGDIFEVNLSQRFQAPNPYGHWALYQRLRAASPAPFAAFLRYPGFSLASSSPERFLLLTGQEVETRPIKGTRPRGHTKAEDLALRQQLWSSAKDRAELVMIVDLERNDLGRVCATGTVRVPELFRLEEYRNVFHLVATVSGTLTPENDVVDLLKATFPGGSITGAPKVRAMAIIEELEGLRRGPYTGSIGWLGFNGDADLNIAIRTLILQGNQAYFQVGGAVTADSDPEAEYQETLAKAQGMILALAT